MGVLKHRPFIFFVSLLNNSVLLSRKRCKLVLKLLNALGHCLFLLKVFLEQLYPVLSYLDI